MFEKNTWIGCVLRNLRMILDPSGTLKAKVNASGFDFSGSWGSNALFLSKSACFYVSKNAAFSSSSFFFCSSIFFCCCFYSANRSAYLKASSWVSRKLFTGYITTINQSFQMPHQFENNSVLFLFYILSSSIWACCAAISLALLYGLCYCSNPAGSIRLKRFSAKN